MDVSPQPDFQPGKMEFERPKFSADLHSTGIALCLEIYGPWTVYKKRCSSSDNQTDGAHGSILHRKLGFGIILALIELFC